MRMPPFKYFLKGDRCVNGDTVLHIHLDGDIKIYEKSAGVLHHKYPLSGLKKTMAGSKSLHFQKTH
jgi:hypothetical protein